MKLFHATTTEQIVAILACFLCALLMSVTFIQAASHDEVIREAREAASAIGEYRVDQKDKAIAEAKKMMKKLDKSMAETELSMKENWHIMEDSATQNYGLSKKEMEEQSQELADWVIKMQGGSADAWEETKKGFSGVI